MALLTRTPSAVAAGYDSSGNPRKVDNSEMVTLLTEMAYLIDTAALGGLLFDDKDDLDADLAHAAGTMAIVAGDSTANDGLYRKDGASGSGTWVKVVSGVPGYGVVFATNAGAGTANAIEATTDLPVTGSQAVYLPIATTNTATPVTVSFNGGTALTIKQQGGEDVEIGELGAGTVINGVVSGSTFQMLGSPGPAGESGFVGTWEGAWQTATDYELNDVVSEDGSSYICIEAHTSGTFATDLAADKWEVVAAKGEPGTDGAGAVDSVNGQTGVVVLDAEDVGAAAEVHTHDDRYYTESETDDALALKADLASPALTGNPTAPTQTAGNNTTRLATTAFVTGAVSDKVSLTTADQTITGGARITTLDLGNLSGTTKTPDPGDRPIQKITNNGAGTIAPGTNQGAYLLIVKNASGAGAITTSGWTSVDGDAFGTATTAEYLCHCTVVGDFSSMTIKEVTA